MEQDMNTLFFKWHIGFNQWWLYFFTSVPHRHTHKRHQTHFYYMSLLMGCPNSSQVTSVSTTCLEYWLPYLSNRHTEKTNYPAVHHGLLTQGQGITQRVGMRSTRYLTSIVSWVLIHSSKFLSAVLAEKCRGLFPASFDVPRVKLASFGYRLTLRSEPGVLHFWSKSLYIKLDGSNNQSSV
jgi:hypothetical protein